MKIRKLSTYALILTGLTAINFAAPFIFTPANAQESQGTMETIQVVQTLNPGNFGISRIPTGFNFSPVNITTPGEKYSYYITSPQGQNNYIEVFDGRYDGGVKITVQVTPHVSGENQIDVTQESVIVSNLSQTQELLGGTPPVSGSDFYYYSDTNPGESSNFHQFPADGILVLMDSPTAQENQGRVGIFRFYPSFKLAVPDNTRAGNYQSTITYTIEDSVN